MPEVDALTLADTAVPAVSAAGWLPQIVRLARKPILGLGLSLGTWALWTLTGAISLIYGVFRVHDTLLTATLGINAAGQLIVFCFALAARRLPDPHPAVPAPGMGGEPHTPER